MMMTVHVSAYIKKQASIWHNEDTYQKTRWRAWEMHVYTSILEQEHQVMWVYVKQHDKWRVRERQVQDM